VKVQWTELHARTKRARASTLSQRERVAPKEPGEGLRTMSVLTAAAFCRLSRRDRNPSSDASGATFSLWEKDARAAKAQLSPKGRRNAGEGRAPENHLRAHTSRARTSSPRPSRGEAGSGALSFCYNAPHPVRLRRSDPPRFARRVGTQQTYPHSPNLPYPALTPAHGRAEDHGRLWEREGGPAVMDLTSSKPRAAIAGWVRRKRGRATDPVMTRFLPAHAPGQTGATAVPPVRHYDRAWCKADEAFSGKRRKRGTR
jgi:hypothetical protein